jgi:hypothetical protein
MIQQGTLIIIDYDAYKKNHLDNFIEKISIGSYGYSQKYYFRAQKYKRKYLELKNKMITLDL